jgi:DNA modification methylase
VTGTAHVIRANSRDLPIADNSVDLVVTSPPYFALRSYQDGGEHYAGQVGDEPTPAAFVESLLEVTAECVRVLKPSGSLWVNLGDKYATRYASTRTEGRAGLNDDDATRGRTGQNRTGVAEKSLIGIPWRYALRCIDDLGLILRAEVIWSKPNGLPESVTDRVRRSHEQWFHFTLSPRYFSAVDEIREAHQDTSPHAMKRGERHSEYKTAKLGAHTLTATNNPLGKLPGSVWTIPTQPLTVPPELGVDHFAAFPMEWPRRIIAAWSPCEGVVLDPFGGTGTTALVAKALGRTGITVDMSADYCRLAQWRTNDPGELARAMHIEKPPKQVEGQLDLFAEDIA